MADLHLIIDNERRDVRPNLHDRLEANEHRHPIVRDQFRDGFVTGALVGGFFGCLGTAGGAWLWSLFL